VLLVNTRNDLIMKLTVLSATLILLAITVCRGQVEEPSSQTNAASHGLQKTNNERPCLTNLADSLAKCSATITKQKRFVLVRSVAIPEN